MQNFKGLGVAMVTPFTSTGAVDYPALEKLVEHLIAGNTNYLVVQGTTAETATLTKEEKKETLAFIIKVTNKRIPIVLGMGGNNTQELIELVKSTDLTGVDGLLSVSPYYNKPSQEGIYQHYKAFAKETNLPIILYNVPGRTGSNMLAETTLRLANECKNIVAIKEASGDLDQIAQIIKNKPTGFMVLSGDDGLSLPSLVIGVEGIISVIGNALPADFSKMIRLCLEENYQSARTLFYQMNDLIPLLFKEGNPAGIKALLKHIGICENNVRLPLVKASEALQNQLKPFVN